MKLSVNKETRTAVILCGGRGTRLGLIAKTIPKSLVKIQNKPIIWYILNILKKINSITLYYLLDAKKIN